MTDFCPYTGSQVIDPDEYIDLENLSVTNRTSVDGVVPTQEYFADLLDGSIPRDDALQAYYWQSRQEDPRINRYYSGMHLFLTDLAGIQPYVYMHKNQSDIYDDMDGCASGCGSIRDMNTVYPTVEGPMSTIEWEALREGIDDYRYLQLWESLHDTLALTDAQLAAASKANVDAALLPFRYGVRALQDSVSIADFDATRTVVALEIESLGQNLADDDGDGTVNHADNCPVDSNPNQTDTDDDGVGEITMDLSSGGFGGDPVLHKSDFEAAATLPNVAALTMAVTDLWTAALNSPALNELMQGGIVQLRLEHTVSSNDNNTRESTGFYSANKNHATLKPKLVVTQRHSLRFH